jgi:hypothetical protein
MGEQIFTMKKEVFHRPSVVSDYLAQSADQKICETALHNFRTFVSNYTNFTHCSLPDYHVWARLSQIFGKMDFENAHGCTQNTANGFRFDFF